MWRVNSVHRERGLLTITEISKFYLFAWKNRFGNEKSQTATLWGKKKIHILKSEKTLFA